jgi:predicted MPP superfamily phosphohydrolase
LTDVLARETVDTRLLNGRRYPLEITRCDLPVRGLALPPEGLVLAHLTDFHGGFAGTDPVIEEAVRLTMIERPDLILLTGDYLDDGLRKYDFPIERYLKTLSARLGVYASFGNHDHRFGLESVRERLVQAGIRILCNESLGLDYGLQIAAIDDIEEGHPDVARALEGVPSDRTTILMSHNPQVMDHPPDRDLVILSGHTHGGQFRVSFPNPELICRLHLQCRQVAGWYRSGNVRQYVNRGLGVTRLPFRVNCPAELVFFRLKNADVDGI